MAAAKGHKRGLMVAVTGAATGLGRRLVDMLADEPAVTGVVAVDSDPAITRLGREDERVVTHRLDLSDPTSGPALGHILTRRRVKAVVHAALGLRPVLDDGAAHELEVIGTLQVLTACNAARVEKLVLTTTTLAYGAHPANPNHLSEAAPLAGLPGFAFVQDKVEAEGEVLRFCAHHRGLMATVLRLSPLLGPGLDTLWGRYLKGPVAPVPMGRDPLVQFLHPHDALRAIRIALLENHPGVFNIVGRGVVPLTTALAMSGTVPLPLPLPMARVVMGTLWTAGVGALPPAAVDYLCHLCVADGEKAARDMGFIPQFSVQETVLNLVGQPPAPTEAAHV